MNAGEAYEKLPRFIPYAALPLGLFLMTFRFAQLAWQVVTREIDIIITSHEAEDLVEEAAAQAKEEN
jgi:C4-dicarboxylate transporter DctQ subunit